MGDLVIPIAPGGGGGAVSVATGVYAGDDTDGRTITTGLTGSIKYVRVQVFNIPNNVFKNFTGIKQTEFAGDAASQEGGGPSRTGITFSGSNFVVDGATGSLDINTPDNDYYWVAFA